MKIFIRLIVLVALIVWAKPNTSAYFQRRAESQIVAAVYSLPRDHLLAATEAYARDRNALNESVNLSELISAGYLRIDDVGVLRNQNVQVTLPSSSQPALIRVRLPGGNELVEFKDGSILKLRP